MQTQIRNVQVASHLNDRVHEQANHNHTKKDASSHIDLLVDELVQRDREHIYVDDSKDDLSEWQLEENDELTL